jgi:hypothetical protein
MPRLAHLDAGVNVEIEPVESWLRSMGCTPVRTENPAFRWSLRFDFPATSTHVMEALSLPNRPNSVVVLTKRSIEARLVSAYDTLSDDARDAFNTELTLTLLRDYIEYRLDQTSSRRLCAAIPGGGGAIRRRPVAGCFLRPGRPRLQD